MHAFAGERIQIDGKGGDERLAFAGLHLCDVAVVEDHAADELNVEMALPERALGGFANDGKSFRQNVLECLAVRRRCLKAGVMAFNSSSDFAANLVFKRIDLGDPVRHGPQFPVVGRAEESLCNRAETQHEILEWGLKRPTGRRNRHGGRAGEIRTGHPLVNSGDSGHIRARSA